MRRPNCQNPSQASCEDLALPFFLTASEEEQGTEIPASHPPSYSAVKVFGSLSFRVGDELLTADDKTLSSRPLVITRSSRKDREGVLVFTLRISVSPSLPLPRLSVRTQQQTGLCGLARDTSLDSFSGLSCLNREESEFESYQFLFFRRFYVRMICLWRLNHWRSEVCCA
jgi:hypothetical protein